MNLSTALARPATRSSIRWGTGTGTRSTSTTTKRQRRRLARTAAARPRGASGSAPRRGSTSPSNRTGFQRRGNSRSTSSTESFPEGAWFPGDFILMTIGQGDTLVTPLQLATAYGALENDGKICPARPGPRRRAGRYGRAPIPSEPPQARSDRREVPALRAGRAHRHDDGQRDRRQRVRRLPVRRRLGGGQDRDGGGPAQAGLLVVRGDDRGRWAGARRGGAGRAGRSRGDHGRADRPAHHRGPVWPGILPFTEVAGTD